MNFLIRLMFIVAVTVLTNHGTFGANVLMIFPAPSYSHTIAARVVANSLVERGHSVTLLTTDARPMSHPNITHIDLSFSYQLWNDGFDFVAYKENGIGIEGMIESFAHTIYDVLIKQLSSPEVQNIIKQRHSIKFDLVIVEAMGFLPYHAFAEIFNAPLMGFNSFDSPMDYHIQQGNYVNPFVVNEAALFPYIDELTFIERWNVIKRLAKIVYAVVIKPDLHNRYKYLLKEFFPMIDSTPAQLLDRIEFLMVNTHPALGFIRPLVPTTIQLGFIHIEKAKPLPNDLQQYLDASKNGVIYLSLGSNVKASKLNPKYIKTFLRVFEFLDYDVIWKWETNEMENKPENVMLSKWLPVMKMNSVQFFMMINFRFISNAICLNTQKSSFSSHKVDISRWKKQFTAKCQS
jgi:glucuronosyltransferase